MKKWKRLLSLLLAVLMLSGALSGLTVTASADETTAAGSTTTGDASTNEKAEEKSSTNDYLYKVYPNEEAKLATMDKKLVKGDYELYSDEVSGEVAVKNVKTGQILMTNPYDVAAGRVTGTDPSDAQKRELLSQIIIKFTDNGKEKTFLSFEEAAEKDQITVKNIKNGIRVEYVIGREEARHLVPRMITNESFRNKILAPIMENVCNRQKFEDAGFLQPGQSYAEVDFSTANMSEAQYKDLFPFELRQLISFYTGRDGMKSIENQKTDSLKKALIAKYPVLNKKPDMEFWVFDSTASSTQLERQEEYLKTNAPDYSYEDLDADHAETEYESDETNPPVFKMALEYTLEEDGFTVRLPVNGLSFNESLYQLTSISILPYMGAGNNAYDGYVFYPDGGGALFAMEDLVDAGTTTLSGKVYGADFAYHQITGTYQQAVRYPAYGIVENTRYYVCTTYDSNNNPIETPVAGVLYERNLQAEKDGKTIDETTHIGFSDIKQLISGSSVVEKTVKRGFVAIIEEGDALTNMAYYHAGPLNNYDTVRMDFNPRPQDKYNLADSISVGTNTEWTVITDRKYTGNFKVHYIMLDDDADSTSGNSGINDDGQYAASWLGMAFAYRDYLEAKGQLQPAGQTSEDIPLYIESFGTEYTTEKIASIPVSVKRALTSAADVKTIYEELKAENITNVNFKLTGYANGGMYGKMPYKLKWEKSVQKSDTDAPAMTMQELFDYAAEETDGALSLFPDFNFAYVMSTGWFDGLSMRKHVVRTIDDRYASRKEYSPTQQRYVSYYQMAISPAYMSHFYEEFMSRYLKMDNLTGISVGSLGTALNSDFDEDEPYNREDARTFITRALEYISSAETREDQTLEVMLDGGNVYTWKYANHILNLPLDSSRYIKASYSVPFIGVLLHGYMNFAGTPLNMEGDVNYAKLKAIENGASPYFLLSYKNTEILKEYYDWSHYYSVRYDIWKDDVVELYTELNEALRDVQDKIIINHEFLSGERIPDADELEGDIDDLFDAVLDYQQNQDEYDTIRKNQAVSEARKLIASAEEQATQFVKNCLNYYSGMSGAAYYFAYGTDSTDDRLMAYVEADKTFENVKAEYEAVKATYDSTAEFEKAEALLVSRYSVAESARKNALAKVRTNIRNVSKSIQSIETATAAMEKLIADIEAGSLLIANSDVHDNIKKSIEKRIETINKQVNEKLGVNLNYTVNMNEVDMFLRSHVAVIMSTTYGESLRSQAGIVGKAENLFDLVLNGEYGLIKDKTEYAILRYLDENADLTDSQLDEKYGLQDDKTSVDGLLKIMRELFDEEKYTFDPVLSDEKGADGYSEIDKHMLGYFTGMLYTRVTGLADTEILPTLNFKSTRVDETKTEKTVDGEVIVTITTKESSNKTNVDTVTKEITTAAKTAFDAFMKDKVAGNDYKVGLNELIEAQIEASREIIKKAYENTDAKKRVEYLTGTGEQVETADGKLTDKTLTVDEVMTDEALGNDLRVFLTSYFYRLAIAKIQPQNTVSSLSILTVSSQTSASLGVLVSDRYAALDAGSLAYGELREAILQDTVANGKLAFLLEKVKGAYGDVSDELRKAYMHDMALKRISKGNLPSDAQLPFAESAKSKSETLASELVTRMLAEMAESIEIDLAPYRAEVSELVGTEGYELRENIENPEENIATFVDAVYLMTLCKVDTRTYYYDTQMATMDYKVREAVAAKHEEIAATLSENATPAEVYDAILKALGNTEDSVAQLTREVAEGITYYIESKYSKEDDVQAYYINLLFNSFADLTGGYTEPLMTVYAAGKNGKVAQLKATETTYKNILKVIDKNYVDARITEIIAAAKKGTARGEIVDYSLSRLLTESEMEAWVTTVYDKIEEGKYLTADENKTEEAIAQLRSDIEAYLRYNYYQTLFNDKMNAAKKAPTLHVSEVYGDSLPEASSGLKKLLRYYMTTLTEFTEKDIDDMLTTEIDKTEEVVTETSKYYTDDGRIVAVTYGSKDTTDSTAKYAAYKTFLLNYNNFSVSVEYDGESYTIPEYGYIVIMSN